MLSHCCSRVAFRAFINNYSEQTAPLAKWAIPEQIVMSKTHEYRRQQEYRVAFATNDAMRVNNVATQLTLHPGESEPSLEGHPLHVLKIGDLRKIGTVHKF